MGREGRADRDLVHGLRQLDRLGGELPFEGKVEGNKLTGVMKSATGGCPDRQLSVVLKGNQLKGEMLGTGGTWLAVTATKK
jgi:hypothetical protein